MCIIKLSPFCICFTYFCAEVQVQQTRLKPFHGDPFVPLCFSWSSYSLLSKRNKKLNEKKEKIRIQFFWCSHNSKKRANETTTTKTNISEWMNSIAQDTRHCGKQEARYRCNSRMNQVANNNILIKSQHRSTKLYLFIVFRFKNFFCFHLIHRLVREQRNRKKLSCDLKVRNFNQFFSYLAVIVGDW